MPEPIPLAWKFPSAWNASPNSATRVQISTFCAGFGTQAVEMVSKVRRCAWKDHTLGDRILDLQPATNLRLWSHRDRGHGDDNDDN